MIVNKVIQCVHKKKQSQLLFSIASSNHS